MSEIDLAAATKAAVQYLPADEPARLSTARAMLRAALPEIVSQVAKSEEFRADLSESYQRGFQDGFWNGKTIDMGPAQAAEFMAPYRSLPRRLPSRDLLIETLHKSGAYCGECDYETRGCNDCDRILGEYAEDILALFAG